MKRREFITLLGGAAVAWPLAARAQQAQVPRIGALVLTNADARSFGKELREGLRKLGYIEGQNFALELRSADGKADLLPELAAKLVQLKVDVIAAIFTCAALVANPKTVVYYDYFLRDAIVRAGGRREDCHVDHPPHSHQDRSVGDRDRGAHLED
jgi:putative ABC transport system substrate-binding protein